MGNSLKQTMVRFHISNKKLGEIIGCTKETASLKVTGKTIITLEEAFKFQEYLEKEIGAFLTIEEIFYKN